MSELPEDVSKNPHQDQRMKAKVWFQGDVEYCR
jgi:hypothetical protein